MMDLLFGEISDAVNCVTVVVSTSPDFFIHNYSVSQLNEKQHVS